MLWMNQCVYTHREREKEERERGSEQVIKLERSYVREINLCYVTSIR